MFGWSFHALEGQPRGWNARCSNTEGNQFGLWQNDPNAATIDGAPEA